MSSNIKILLSVAEIIQLISTYPILIQIIGPKIFYSNLEKVLSKTKNRIRVNIVIYRKFKRLYPLLIFRLFAITGMTHINVSDEILRYKKQIKEIDLEINNLHLGIWGTVFTSFSFYLLLSFIIFISTLLIIHDTNNFSLLQFVLFYIFYLLIITIIGPIATPYFTIGILRIIFEIVNLLVAKLLLPTINFLIKTKSGKRLTIISYYLFLLGFVIRFIIGLL